MSEESSKRDYRDIVFLQKTDFSIALNKVLKEAMVRTQTLLG